MRILLHHSEAADPELIKLMMGFLRHIFDFNPVILILAIFMFVIIIPVMGILIFKRYTKLD